MIHFSSTPIRAAALAMLLIPGWALGDDQDALLLESGPAPAVETDDRPMRLYLEASIGRVEQRYGLPALTASRLSLDFNYNQKLGGGWRFALSDRLDYVDPPALTGQWTINSLREAYVSWQDDDGSRSADFGRVNLRHGPAYGYNPTDYFRKTALRAITTADPLALRENRLGTVMLRAQQLWPGGAMSIALAPNLADARSTESFNPDLGATNRQNRALVSWSAQASDRFSGQVLAFYDEDAGSQLGLNFTALLTDSIVGHFEWSRGKDQIALSGEPAKIATRNRLSGGATYTTPIKLALTAEYEYNGFAPGSAAWNAAGVDALGTYLIRSLSSQEIVSRNAWTFYAVQKGVVWKGLDVSALLRLNADDDSRLGWIEVRYHWPRFDAALQWQSTHGAPMTEYGLPPSKRSLKLLGALYF